jgi:hypothetical protein
MKKLIIVSPRGDYVLSIPESHKNKKRYKGYEVKEILDNPSPADEGKAIAKYKN